MSKKGKLLQGYQLSKDSRKEGIHRSEGELSHHTHECQWDYETLFIKKN